MEVIEQTEQPKKPTKPRTAHRKKRTAAKPKGDDGGPKGPDTSKWAGATKQACPTGCTPEHCLVSTVNVCKHPYMNGDAGCGPITMKNRDELKRYLKHQDVER